eukprot:SAG22_NODE_106_length_19904_cov_14.387175_13_plen_230_part_00
MQVVGPELQRRLLNKNPAALLQSAASHAEGLTAEGLAAEQAECGALLAALHGQLFAGLQPGDCGSELCRQPAIAAAACRLASAFARWLARPEDSELLLPIVGGVLQLVPAVRSPASQADREMMKHVGAALRNLCGRAAPQLAAVCAATAIAGGGAGGLLPSLVASVNCLSSGVEWEVSSKALSSLVLPTRIVSKAAFPCRLAACLHRLRPRARSCTVRWRWWRTAHRPR